ncbi:MAG: hypothetical protein KER_00389 [Kerstersia gyiorum]
MAKAGSIVGLSNHGRRLGRGAHQPLVVSQLCLHAGIRKNCRVMGEMGEMGEKAGQWVDDRRRYGLVTRVLHGAMALLFAWQFLGMAIKLSQGRTPLAAFFVGTHAPVGTLLLMLLAVRLIWAGGNLRHRPPQGQGWQALAARLGHGMLYLLMLMVPLLAGLRAYGSGRGLNVWGWQVLPATGAKVDWMMAPGNALHGVLAWCLLALIGGHIAMALWHRVVLRDGVMARMFGPLR